MPIVDMITPQEDFINPNDSIVIVDNFASIRGGRTLDVTGFPLEHIWGGHPIIRETASDELKPLPLNGTNDGYAVLPEGHTYEGILVATIPAKSPFAGIMTQGTVNHKCMQFDSSGILTALETALPLIDFRSDDK